jgi:SWI/SNF-related matrix-associated actin-dependent regulator 1 of chromatin subfamily A
MLLTRRTHNEQELFVLVCPFEQRELPGDARFAHDRTGNKCGVKNAWFTPDIDKAIQFLAVADRKTREYLTATRDFYAASLVMSDALDADIIIPAPAGLAYLPYQKASVAYFYLQVGDVGRTQMLIGDDMGLGKTVQTAGVINYDETIKRVLIISPSNLKINWRREMEKWLVRSHAVQILDGRHVKRGRQHIERPELDFDYIRLTILNYDIVGHYLDVEKKRIPLMDKDGKQKTDKKGKLKFKTEIEIKGLGLLDQDWDLIVADEAHYLKNPEAARSRYCYAVIPKGKRRILLTGTPLPNRPEEAWPLLNLLDPQTWANYYSFINKYCNAQKGQYGIKCEVPKDPAARAEYFQKLAELQDKMRRTVMVRRRKARALPQLPAKTRQVIEIPVEGDVAEVVEQEREGYLLQKEELKALRVAFELSKATDDPREYDAAVEALKDGVRVMFTKMSALRHATARAKLPYMIAHLHDCLDQATDWKVVFFAHHVDVIESVAKEFNGLAVVLRGGIAKGKKQAAVDRFQSDDTVKLFCGQTLAAGVGLTLTASSHVVMGELDWTPGNVTQAEDRCHRIGQKDNVLVQHLVLEGSLDATIAKRMVVKQQVIDASLDDPYTLQEMEVPELPDEGAERAATQGVTFKQIEKQAARLTGQEIAAAHIAIKIIASLCEQDGKGFNAIDGIMGQRLAELQSISAKQAALAIRIARRYHKQLPAEIVDIIGRPKPRKAKKDE